MPQNVAITLFVKDEFSDIAGWIAWHAALGVKTFFVYDDHSTDGTWEILEAASKCYDIRLRRTDPVKTPAFQERQRDAYMQSAEEANGEFDWLGFLDGDEYLYLRHAETLPDFLDRFSHADAIGFSWRIYGSAGRAVRPRIPIVEAFPRHAPQDFSDNFLIKSFVRPKKMGTTYLDPHCFDVAPERYVRPSGRFTGARDPRQDVEWSDAFVMHFICRSMEHYVQRIKRRLNKDLSDTTDYWQYYNRNDHLDTGPLRFLPKMQEKLGPIQHEVLKMAIQTLKDLPITPTSDLSCERTSQRAPEIFEITPPHHTELYYDPEQKQTIHCTRETAKQKQFKPVFGALDPQTPSLLTLFIAGDASCAPVNIPNETRHSIASLFQIVPWEGNKKNLFNPGSQQFICFIPPDNNGIGKIEANRATANDWEALTLERLPDEKSPFAFPKLPFDPTTKTSAYTVLSWIKTSPELPDENTFLRVLYSLSAKAQQDISKYVPGLLWDFI